MTNAFTVADFLAHLDHAEGRAAAGASDLPAGYKLVHVLDAGIVFPAAEEREAWRMRPSFVAWPRFGDPQAETSWEAKSIAYHRQQAEAYGLADDREEVTPEAHGATLGRA